MNRAFSRVASAALGVVMLFNPLANTLSAQQRDASKRHTKATVTALNGGTRIVDIDCESLVAVPMADGSRRLAPRVGFAALFDQLPDEELVNSLNGKPRSELEAYLRTLKPEERRILETMLILPVEQQQLIFTARNDRDVVDRTPQGEKARKNMTILLFTIKVHTALTRQA